MSTKYFSLSGATLRALSAEGDQSAMAEISRRASKPGKPTVAALRSRGAFQRAQERIDQAQVAKVLSKAVKPHATAPARISPTAGGVVRQKATSGPLRDRVSSLEAGLLALSGALAEQRRVLDLIATRLLA